MVRTSAAQCPLRQICSNKCIASSNKCLTSSNKKLLIRNNKLLVTSASLLVTRMSPFAPCPPPAPNTSSHPMKPMRQHLFLVPSSFLLLLVRHLFLVAYCFLVAMLKQVDFRFQSDIETL